MDGLSALQRPDDADYLSLRSELAADDPLPVSDGFALHPSLKSLHEMAHSGQAVFLPAVAGPYRERSHFQAQDLLESGTVDRVLSEGWLNRALQVAPGRLDAVAIGVGAPLILRGAAQTASWSPPVLGAADDDTLTRLAELYADDRSLGRTLALAHEGAMMETAGMAGEGGRQRPYDLLAQACGRIMADPQGPDIAVVSLEGWDTHARQRTLLDQRFAQLDSAILILKNALAGVWSRTVVMAISEFGRTARANGAGGTDHGTAGLAMLLGGGLAAAPVVGDWPGLRPSQLFEDRDVQPTIDARSVCKGLLRDHFGFDRADLDRRVFPDSGDVPPLSGLLRS
jgi:uncharacterized protein (DUF1501 family)